MPPIETSSMRGVSLVVFAAAAWGTWSLFLRPTGLPPLWTGTLVFSLVALSAFPFFGRDGEAKWDRSVMGLLAAFAVLDAINVGTFFAAMSMTSVAIAVLTHSFAPVVVALAAPFVEGQRVRAAPYAAAIALGGITLLLQPWEPDALEGSVVLGAALGSISALAYAANVFLARHLTTRIGPIRTMGLHSIGSALLLLPFALAQPAEIELWHVGVLWIAAALLGVGANVAFAIGLVRIGSARGSVLAFVEPLVACIVGWLVWGESMGPLSIVGGALIIGAGVLVATGKSEPVLGRAAVVAAAPLP